MSSRTLVLLLLASVLSLPNLALAAEVGVLRNAELGNSVLELPQTELSVLRVTVELDDVVELPALDEPTTLVSGSSLVEAVALPKLTQLETYLATVELA